MAVVEGEDDSTVMVDNSDKELYDRLRKAKARPTSDALPPPLLAAKKTPFLRSSPPSFSSSSSCSSPSSSSWSSSWSRSSSSPASASANRRSSVKSASRSRSAISSSSNSEAGHRGGHRRGGRNSGNEHRARSSRATRHHNATDEDPVGASRHPVLPATKNSAPTNVKEGNDAKGGNDTTDAGRPYEDDRTSPVTEKEGNRGKHRHKRSHGDYEKEYEYRRPGGTDTDHGRYKHHRPPRERRRGHRSSSRGANRDERRYSRHEGHDEEIRVRGRGSGDRSGREPEHGRRSSGDRGGRTGGVGRKGKKHERRRRETRYPDDARDGGAVTNARQSRHHRDDRDNESRRRAREAQRRSDRKHGGETQKNVSKHGRDHHRRRLSRGDTGVERKKSGGAGSGGEVSDFSNPPTEVVAASPNPLGMAAWAGRDHLDDDDEKVEIVFGKYTRAVVTVQRLVRGFRDRGRVSRRRDARVTLRDACLEVGMDIVEDCIRQVMAPDVIASVLAEGVEGVIAPSRRAGAPIAAQALMEETVASMVAETAKLAVREETNSHLDVIFVRDRRNPLLALVDDVVSDTLRVCMKEGVVEAVRECTEDFMFGRRLFALVEELIEEEVVGSAGPIAHGVYYSSSALATFWELEQEVCTEEAVSVVAETMAPFEDHLVHLQRMKDVAAIQSAAQSVVVKGLQLQHAARTLGQRGRLVIMSDINGKTLNLLLAGRFLAILRAAETNRLQVAASPLLSLLFRRLVVRTGRSVLLDELSRELDRDETALHELELERIDEVDRQRRAVRDRAGEGISSSSSSFVVKP